MPANLRAEPPLDDQEQQTGANPPTPSYSFDPLVIYDTETIGNEFKPFEPVKARSEENETRRAQLAVNSWREVVNTAKDRSVTGPNAKCFSSTRNHEVKSACTQSVMTWVVTLAVAALAGILFAVIIKMF